MAVEPGAPTVMLALDASSLITGWAVFHCDQVAATGPLVLSRGNPRSPLPERLRRLCHELDQLADLWHPELVVVSQASGIHWRGGSRHSIQALEDSLSNWSQCRGLLVSWYTAQEVRLAACGREHASKSQLAFAVMSMLGAVGQMRSENEWEAMAAGYYHLALASASNQGNAGETRRAS
ncbi:MAG: crossover junction endodeoxyribonuclease RuvC [SAR202 cluster bacterium]|nr:crossover junction endodeoxyribonuclease RuvC [SAR202 cluster bacterium]